MGKKLSEDILNALKTEIVFNKLHAGDRIGEEELCKKYNVSRTPVRQALQRLENLGLLEVRDGVGTFVTMIYEEDLKDAYMIKCAAEKLAAENAIYAITDSELEEQEKIFMKILNQLEKGGYGSSFEEMILADWHLHDMIMDNSGNPMLKKVMEPVTLLLRRCQFAYISQYKRATLEHLEIINCFKKRDIEKLKIVLEKHLQYKPA